MFAAMNPETGALPQAGPPLTLYRPDSDTYQAWNLIGTRQSCSVKPGLIFEADDTCADNYYIYSGDHDWLSTVWTNYTRAVAFLEGKVDSTGLMNVTALSDWARQGGGGYNAEGNAILYKVGFRVSFHDIRFDIIVGAFDSVRSSEIHRR